MAWCSVKNA